MSGAQLPQPNAYVLGDGGTRVLLDFGASGEKTLDVPNVDAALITHAHWDHCGGLVSLVEARIPVYATPATARFISFALIPVVGEVRARAIMDTIVTQRFHETFEIGGFSLAFLPSGHMEGAAMIMARSESGSVLYTGDFSTAELLSSEPLVSAMEPIDLLLCETSLVNLRVEGDDLTAARETLVELSAGLVVGRALGDLQEAAAVLDANDARYVVHENTGLNGGLSQKDFLKRIDQGDVGLVAGDLSAGSASFQMAEPLLQNPAATIVLLNGVGRSPIGASLLKTPRRSKVLWNRERVRLRAHVYWLSLRLHASREEIVGWIPSLQASRVVLVHGPRDGQEIVAGKLRQRGIDVVIGETGDAFTVC